MNIHEHQAKQILKEFGAPVSKGVVIFSVEEIKDKLTYLRGEKFVLKAQIHAGGRGKAGGVKLIKNLSELETEANINYKNTTESFMTSKRQFLLATKSMEYLTQSKIKFGKNMPFELVSQDIRFFLNNIAEITGEISNNDLYDVLFSKFCIGK